nr:MAG TPA_asm: terminase large subunit [Caudoviricetes sp.]
MPRNPKQDANLIPTNKRSKSEVREIGQKGGIASGVARAKRSTLQSIARAIADAPAPDKLKAQIEKSGLAIDDEDMNGNAAVVAGVYRRAIQGEDKAVEKWESWTDVQTADEKPFYIPAYLMGKAFVDINRNIEPNKTYIFEGGRGGLKSSYVSLKVVELLKNNPTMHACVLRKVGGTLKDSVFSQIKWAIHALGLDDEFQCKANPIEIVYKKTGQIIYFRGCDDPIKLKSIKPPFGYIGILWIEERDQLSGAEEERSVKQSVLRGGALSYDFTSYNPPKSRDNWVNKQLREPNANRVVHHSTYIDAPPEWLGRKFIDDAEHLKTVDPKAYEHEYMGVPNGDGGNVFDKIEIRTITDEEISHFDHIFQGVDWGWYPDPFAFVRLNYDRTRETITFIAEITNNKTSNEQNAEKIKAAGYDDAYITCDSAEPKSVNDFRSAGLPAKLAVKGPGSIDYGMKWLQVRKLIIDPARTPRVYNEFLHYEFERDKDGNVISGYPDANNHTIDATRYALERVYNKFGSKA